MRVHMRQAKARINYIAGIGTRIKCMAIEAMEFIKCGGQRAICGEFRCSEEVRITENRK